MDVITPHANAIIDPDAGAAPPSTAEAVARLRRLVDDSAGRWRRWTIAEAFGLAVGVPLAYLWLVFLLDNLLHLPAWARVLANLVFLTTTAALVLALVRRWRRLRFTEDQVALAMERHTPGGVQNRLINALQISRETQRSANPNPNGNGSGDRSAAHPSPFGEALVEENYRTLQRAALRPAGESRPALLRVTFAALMVVAGVLFWALQRDRFTNAAARIMLPLASVDPIYRTTLEVEPGDVEIAAAGDVPIRVRIKGEAPGELTVLRVTDGRRTDETVPVVAGRSEVEYTLRGVDRSMTYAVRGGDFTTRFFQITVPRPSALASVRVTYQFPAYTRLPEKTVQSAGGDLEALAGTTVKLVFVLDHPADAAWLVLRARGPIAKTQATGGGSDAGGDAGGASRSVALEKVGPTEFAGQLTFGDDSSYQLETRQANRPADLSPHYALNVLADKAPELQLTGIDVRAGAAPDAVLPLAVDASDDYGLETVGLYARKVSEELAGLSAGAESAGRAATRPTTTLSAEDDGWKPVEVWPAGGALQLHKDVSFAVASLGGAEGDRYELAPRGADADPAKGGALATGPTHTLVIGGDDVALQLLYEQILRTEAALKSLVIAQDAGVAEAAKWIGKLNPASGLRWDDQANLDALAAGVKAMAGEQVKLREASGRAAREMVAQAGNLRISLGMLADSEMVRATRILEAVPGRETPQDKRAAMTDAKATQERTVRSLREIAAQYARFRQDWELANMIPFVKVLADRQRALQETSAKNAALPSGSIDAATRAAAGRRQAKVAQLCGLSRVAFEGLTERVKPDEPILGQGFAAAATSLGASELTGAMTEAAAFAAEGQWAAAAPKQDAAAKALATIYEQLQAAKLEAARQALAAIREKAKSDVASQAELERLRAGHADNAIEGVDESQLKVAEIIHMRDVAAGKRDGQVVVPEDDLYRFDDANSAALQQADSGMRQELKNMSLASTPSGPPKRFPNQSDRQSNNVKPHIQQEFDDLVGDLLEEADILQEKYDTYNINAGFNINEVGDVGKQGGDMNSTAAASATGNQKPPPNDQGGISRQGRMGARAHGMVAGNEGVKRRGRDEVQEGQERVPDQAGTIKQQHSDDEQPDISTGVGGKKVETDDDTTFNTSDKGTFTDDMAERMGKVADKNAIVERQDGRLDPRIADMLRDLGGTQEQVIERLKVIRKELRNLYLPTDAVDEAMKELTANLESLKDRPSGEIFRLQSQALDRLRDALGVFTEYGPGVQPSLPRDQAVRGRVLDEPARQPLPEYEEAVKRYYEALAGE